MSEDLGALLRAASQHDGAATATLLQQHLPALRAFVRLFGGELSSANGESDPAAGTQSFRTAGRRPRRTRRW